MVNLGFDLGKIKPCICGQMPRFEFFEGGPNKNNIIQIYCTRYSCNIQQFAIGPTIESTINTWNNIIDGYSNVKEEPEDDIKLKVCPVCGYSFAFGDVCPACQAELKNYGE